MSIIVYIGWLSLVTVVQRKDNHITIGRKLPHQSTLDPLANYLITSCYL